MDFSSPTLIPAFVFGLFGSALLVWGKNRGNLRHIAIALALFVYPYFFENLWMLWGIGTALLGAAWWLR
jgi:hypothetical protein